MRTILELNGDMSRGRLTARALVERCLERIGALDGRMRAFIHVDREGALATAAERDREARRGQFRGLLHGIPIAIKDLFDQEGLPTTAGAAIRRDRVAEQNATAVERLIEDGAVIIGKTNLHEFAFGVTSVNPHFGPVGNPWAPDRVAGGSSGGSGAAVAAGMCIAALGTDTGGSIRIPAAMCSIVGLKPTFGRLSRHGVVPLSWSFDTIGPMTRCVEDAALLLSVLSRPDSRDPLTAGFGAVASAVPEPPSRVRIGLLTGPLFSDGVDAEIGAAVADAAAALSRLGAHISPVRLQTLEAGQVAQTTILFAEASAYHLRAYPGRLDDYGPDVRELLAEGATIPATAYVDAQRVQTLVIQEIGRVLEEVDVLMGPSVPVQTPLIADVDPMQSPGWRKVRAPISRCTRLFNLTGLPAVSLPIGRTRDGLPIGAQFAAAPGEESRLLGVASLLQQEIGWELPEV